MTDDLGYAVIGAGLVGPRHARFADAASGSTVRVICDLDEQRGRALAEQHGADWVADYRDVMIRDDVQVMSVCLPTVLHLDVATAAAQAGKHVLLEKPIETTPDRAAQLVQTCRDHGVKLGAVFNRRFLPALRRTHEAVHSGELGDVLVADMVFKAWRSAEYYSESGWRGTWDKEGGGALINQGIHGVDLITWLAGPITRVQAVSRHLRHPEIEADDTTIAVVEYASGAVGVIEQTTSIRPARPDRIELHGQQGSIALRNYEIEEWSIEGSTPGEPDPGLADVPGFGEGPNLGHFLQIQDMVDAVREDREPAVTGEMALHSLQVVHAIYTSERTRAAVDVPAPSAWPATAVVG